MKKAKIKTAIIALLFGASNSILAQNVAINTSGNSAYTSAILDLSNQNTVGTVGFLPPYVTLTSLTTFGLSGTASQSNGIVVYCTGLSAVPAGLYYWNNSGTTWVAMSGASLSGGTNNYLARWTSATALGTGVAQDNGSAVGISSSAITPKSILDVKGGISVGAYAGNNAAPSNGIIVSGQSGFGNNTPASSAVVDFTNTQATGSTGAPILWPTNPSPSTNISSPALGEEVYNTSTGCFNFYNGSAWVVNGCPCTIAPTVPTIAASCSQSFQGSSITYTSSITTGVTYNWTVTATTGTPTVTGNGTSSITVTWPSGGVGTGTVNLTLTNLCGTSAASPLSVIINANPTISGTTPIGINTTGNIYTCSQAGATYSWSSNNTNGVIVGSITGQSVNVTAGSAAGAFTLTCNVSFGACSYAITYAVSVVTCAGVISVDNTAASGDGTKQFTIITTKPDDLVIVSCNGYAGPFTGSVAVTGAWTGAATLFTNKSTTDCGVAIYWFLAPTAGSYTVKTTETGYTDYANFGIALTGFCSVPNASDIVYSNSTTTSANIASISTTLQEAAGSVAIGSVSDFWLGTEGDLTSWTNLTYLNQASDVEDDYGVATMAIPTATASSTITVAKTSGTMEYGVLVLLDIH